MPWKYSHVIQNLCSNFHFWLNSIIYKKHLVSYLLTDPRQVQHHHCRTQACTEHQIILFGQNTWHVIHEFYSRAGQHSLTWALPPVHHIYSKCVSLHSSLQHESDSASRRCTPSPAPAKPSLKHTHTLTDHTQRRADETSCATPQYSQNLQEGNIWEGYLRKSWSSVTCKKLSTIKDRNGGWLRLS